MLALFNLAPSEILIGLVVAVLVFGRRLPEVAVQTAGQLQKFKRALTDFKRETGIDEELRSARRSLQDVVPRDDWRRTLDAPGHFAREVEREIADAADAGPLPPPPRESPQSPPAQAPPPAPEDGSRPPPAEQPH